MSSGVMIVWFCFCNLVNSSVCQKNSAKAPRERTEAVTLNSLGFLLHPFIEKLVHIHMKGKPLVLPATGPLTAGRLQQAGRSGVQNSLCRDLLFQNHPTDSQRLVELLQKSHCEHFFFL